MNQALVELQLLNCAIDSEDPYFFAKQRLDREWFPTFRQAYDFIHEYVRNNGEVPTLTTVKSRVSEFDFAEFESAESLRRHLGDMLAKKEFSEWLRTIDSGVSFERVKDNIVSKTSELNAKYGISVDQASNWRTNGKERMLNYIDRESNKRMLIPSGFKEIDEALTGRSGAFSKGDYIVVYGGTKRGKSTLARKLTTIPASRAGYRVLDLCLENERAEIEFLLDSVNSADEGIIEAKVDGVDTYAGFERRRLVYGYLDDQRDNYAVWTAKFDESNTKYGDYIVKTFEDDDMDVVDIERIKALVSEHKPDVLLVDPIYLTTYPRTGEKTPGSGAQAMSRALRRLATMAGIVVVVTVQSTIEEKDADDESDELVIPKLSNVKTSKSLLEDGTVTFGVDSNKHGKAVIEIMLSRKGGADKQAHIQYFPNFGIIRSIDEALQVQLTRVNATKLF